MCKQVKIPPRGAGGEGGAGSKPRKEIMKDTLSAQEVQCSGAGQCGPTPREVRLRQGRRGGVLTGRWEHSAEE